MAARFDPPKGVHTFFLGGTHIFKKADAMAKLKEWSIYDNGVETYFVENFDFKGRMYLQVYFAKDENHVISFDVHEIFPDEHKVIKKEKDMDNSHFTSQTDGGATDSVVVKNLNERINALTKTVLDLERENAQLRCQNIEKSLQCNRYADQLKMIGAQIEKMFCPDADDEKVVQEWDQRVGGDK